MSALTSTVAKAPLTRQMVATRLAFALLAWCLGLVTANAAPAPRDLEPYFYLPLPPFESNVNGPGIDTLAIGLPVPPSVVRRNMLTNAPLATNGERIVFLLQRYDSPSALKLFKLFAATRFAPYYTATLGIEQIQSGSVASVKSFDQTITDRYTFGSPVQRTALDGSVYEAVPVTVDRNGVPYTTLYFGYRIGSVAAQTAANVPAAEREYYDLESVPAPTVEGLVTEYIYRPAAAANPPRGHFFYAASEAERATLDGSADWMRSGREFKNGGYLPVCRFFYRPANGGPATHFYTAKADECEQLKTTAGFTYEGTPFRASLPRPQKPGQAANDPARCPEKTVPLWRFFNQPADPAIAPNHRYLTNSLLGPTTMREWADEGIGLCVPE